mmetsp:Transcript_16459/g.27936  ORF Transcript_16459/g.27936 Transcript_16459/m.27936 type:complete len:496 (+) Transcript_16459:1240-2727(+)
MWLFEKGQGQPRLLKQRQGLAETPSKIRFYGGRDDPVMQGARNIIACAQDGSLRDINLLNEFASLDFSRKNFQGFKHKENQLDFGRVTDFDFCEFREQDWQNLVSAHEKRDEPLMWSAANHQISKVAVKKEAALAQQRVISVGVSQCGNFGVLGYENGQIQKFNLQSGNDRGLFRDPEGQAVHSKEVTGVGVDQLNHYLVSCSLDSSLKLWDFVTMKLTQTVALPSPVLQLTLNRRNELVAIASNDLSVSIFNSKRQLKKVREFPRVCENRVTDLCFSQPDSKYLLCSSLDKSIRVLDILTGCLVDWIQFQRAPLSIDFALSGEFLATSHVGSKAVYLWSNKAFFQNLVIEKEATTPFQIELPRLSLVDEQFKVSHKDYYSSPKQEEGALEQEEMPKNLIQRKLESVESQALRVSEQKQLGDGAHKFVQLSDQPYSKWQSLFNLEQIKERNKPKLPKHELPKTPFFLFDLDKVMAGEKTTMQDLLGKDSFFNDAS